MQIREIADIEAAERDPRRIARVLLSAQFLIDIHKPSAEVSWVRCSQDPLPPDAVVVDVTPQAEHKGTLVVVLQSEAFGVVEDGAEVPTLPPPAMERVYRDG